MKLHKIIKKIFKKQLSVVKIEIISDLLVIHLNGVTGQELEWLYNTFISDYDLVLGTEDENITIQIFKND